MKRKLRSRRRRTRRSNCKIIVEGIKPNEIQDFRTTVELAKASTQRAVDKIARVEAIDIWTKGVERRLITLENKVDRICQVEGIFP